MVIENLITTGVIGLVMFFTGIFAGPDVKFVICGAIVIIIAAIISLNYFLSKEEKDDEDHWPNLSK